MRVLHTLCKGQLQEICCVPLRALLLRDLVHQWNKKGALEKCSNPMLFRARRLRASCQKAHHAAHVGKKLVPLCAGPTFFQRSVERTFMATHVPARTSDAKPSSSHQCKAKPRALSRSRLPLNTNGDHGSGSH